MTAKTLLAALPATVLLAVAPAAFAADLDVTRIDDPDPNGCLPGDCSLREAVLAASADPGTSDRIRLRADRYELTRIGAGEDAGRTGDLDLRGSVTVEGAPAGGTRIDGTFIDRVIDVGPSASSADVTLRGLTVTGGYMVGSDGGGIRSGADAAITLDRVALVGNHAVNAGSDGGGLFSLSTTTIRESVIADNVAAGDGGGISHEGLGVVQVSRTTIARNDAGSTASGAEGGGMDVRDFGRMSIETSTIAGNEAHGPGAEGGGIHTGRPTTILASTITGNATPDPAGLGGGIHGFVSVGGSILGGNRTGRADAQFANCTSSLGSLGHNLEDGDSCALREEGDRHGVADLRLGALADTGGLPSTIAPLPGSPALDGGAAECGATDQRGVPRPQGRACDIGAQEVIVPQPATAPAPATPAPPAPAATPRAALPSTIPARPALSGLTVRTRRGRTTIRVSLDRPAQLEAVVTTRPKRGKPKKVATLRKAGRRGANTLTKKLAPGRYRVSVVARTGTTRSTPRGATFTVKRTK